MMTANIRSFLSSLAFMMHSRVMPADYTREQAERRPINEMTGFPKKLDWLCRGTGPK
jgi:hypothetical protein